MKYALSAALMLCFAAVLRADDPYELPKPDDKGVITIFDGKTLDGWTGDAEVWKVDNGEIVGKSEKGLKQNTFLKSRFSVADFRLTLQIKLTPNTANSGIQFRSVPFQGHEMKGCQADVGKGWWGKIYEESGRGLLVKEGGEQFVKPEEWNTYEIVAVGSKVLIAINGNKCAELDDDKQAMKGMFGLQVHSGGPTEVRFKDLKLTLNPKAELETLRK